MVERNLSNQTLNLVEATLQGNQYTILSINFICYFYSFHIFILLIIKIQNSWTTWRGKIDLKNPNSLKTRNPNFHWKPLI